MTLHKIIFIPDPRLKTRCTKVDIITDTIKYLLDDMIETMYNSRGIGLAAPQIGVMKRLVVIDISEERNDSIKLINPEIIFSSNELIVNQEGCLSIPQQLIDITRPAFVYIRYIDEYNKKNILKANGLLSICIQHEIDHLNGILITDYLSILKRKILIKKVYKLQKMKF